MPCSRLAPLIIIGAFFPVALLLPPSAVGQEAGDEARIASALAAGPPEVTGDATIMDWPSEPGGEMTELRSGTNGWVCLPDSPGTPAEDPMCVDPAFTAWIEAYVAQETPVIDRVGFGYMLRGGSTPSNTDPFASEPAPGEDWVMEPPHVMMVVPDPAALEGLTTDPDNGGPWVMWAGTPYAHVMMPVGSDDPAMPAGHDHGEPRD